ncbi:hypothetical protein F4821DRAFT_240102 [Hypoxylon rubiginosum]|uniref:Uncharacterized protein n=1 Tax=Hypoxylon rubiginosum TaxID=110542 RepID=A0ACC0CYR0_9PEZI|nr:hypothetical protein F4821DRAFT_240102 [Hypoxylon rubiginosum]
MHSSLFFLAPLASLLQTSAGLPAEEGKRALELIKLPIIPLNQTQYWADLQASKNGNLMEKRDDCASSTPYTQSDMDALISSLQSDGQSDYLPAASSTGWLLGTAKVCTYNNYIFDNTHVSHWEIGWGAGYVKGLCCPSESANPQCSGGSCTGQGDSGLNVIIATRNSALSC